MLRGTRLLTGQDAMKYQGICETLRIFALDNALSEIVVPAIWEAETFDNKVGDENASMMWKFKDKKERNVCLVPEITGICQELYDQNLLKGDIFYISRCYRYERPQRGRYREFTQFGVELLGQNDVEKAFELMKKAFEALNLYPEYDESVKRGLSYYTNPGFEARIDTLGAQKQVAGGGAYKQGVGFAIGIDRVMLCK